MATEQTVSQEGVVQKPHHKEAKRKRQARDKPEGKKEGTALRDREPGKSVLPFSRVQRIIKADKASPVAATHSSQRTSDGKDARVIGPSYGC
ncbi:hypothetical protein J3R82DRAFT_9846 [Butyriboletus roseoflavus]|nr:hypothetical protein J3R82DRAFT_9846 [Butyriboletus roseoflavus]